MKASLSLPLSITANHPSHFFYINSCHKVCCCVSTAFHSYFKTNRHAHYFYWGRRHLVSIKRSLWPCISWSNHCPQSAKHKREEDSWLTKTHALKRLQNTLTALKHPWKMNTLSLECKIILIINKCINDAASLHAWNLSCARNIVELTVAVLVL